MKKNEMSLRPIHYASVSGGKDSLYMLNLILNNPQKYPLDMVVHFELEIDWDWTKKVIDFMEERCTAAGLKFIRIKPTHTWQELYDKYGMPVRAMRWCNSQYKMDAKNQLNKWIKSQNCRPVAYIGLCADEKKRFKYEIGDWENQDVCYPLAEEGIVEDTILEWAQTKAIFQGWYRHFRRQGCMLCPMITRKELAYMYKYEPEQFEFFFKCADEWEKKWMKPGSDGFFHMPLEKVKKTVITKWLPILEAEEAQGTIFDFIEE